jgi:hypothetical protein
LCVYAFVDCLRTIGVGVYNLQSKIEGVKLFYYEVKGVVMEFSVSNLSESSTLLRNLRSSLLCCERFRFLCFMMSCFSFLSLSGVALRPLDYSLVLEVEISGLKNCPMSARLGVRWMPGFTYIPEVLMILGFALSPR